MKRFRNGFEVWPPFGSALSHSYCIIIDIKYINVGTAFPLNSTGHKVHVVVEDWRQFVVDILEPEFSRPSLT